MKVTEAGTMSILSSKWKQSRTVKRNRKATMSCYSLTQSRWVADSFPTLCKTLGSVPSNTFPPAHPHLYNPPVAPSLLKGEEIFFGEEIVCARLSIWSPGQTLARIVTFYQYWWSVISLVAAGMYSQKYMMWWCHHCSNIRVCLNLDPVNQFIWRLVAISRHTNMRCVRRLPAEYITPLK